MLLSWGSTQNGLPTLICWTNPHILREKKKNISAQRIPLFPKLSHFLSRLREVEKITVKKVVATAPKAFYQTYAYMKYTLTGYVTTPVSSHLRKNTYTNKRQKYLRWAFIRSEITRENLVSVLTLPKYPRLAQYWRNIWRNMVKIHTKSTTYPLDFVLTSASAIGKLRVTVAADMKVFTRLLTSSKSARKDNGIVHL